MAITNDHGIGSGGLPIEGRNMPPHMIPLPGDRPTRTGSNKLEDQAATAALYVTNQDIGKPQAGQEFLDSDNKLSSAGAAASLKYAKPRDLPSYPSAGLNNNQSGAGTAASVGWQNQKTFEHWKPDPSASAFAAAILAKDYKMKPSWQPESSAHGAKAALLAHKANKGVDIWQPEPTAWGNLAATQAMKKGDTLSPQLNYGHTAVGRQGSLLAATGAMSSSRKRANSTPSKVSKPETYPDEANASKNALKAAVSVHKSQNATSHSTYDDGANVSSYALKAATSARNAQAGLGQGACVDEANASSHALKAAVSAQKSRTTRKPNTFEKGVGSVPFTTLPPEMYTSNPPVENFGQELNKDQIREDVLKASAIAMAKKMYNQQQQQFDDASHAKSGAAAAHGQRKLSIESDDEPTPIRFNNLQERAQQLANDRISKMTTEDSQYREYRNYYGGGGAPSVSSRLSIRGRTRRRASSFDEDRHQSDKIRAQMNLFSSNISQVDEKKRQRDREALIAAAQRKVNEDLHNMDEQVFADTGKVAPSLLSEWELKAHQAAQAKCEARLGNFGKVDIGGGKFVDQSVIDAAAAKKIQPVLDEMGKKADAQRFRDAELKLDEQNQKRKSQEAKAREKESKEISKKLKQQEKDEEKERKADEKAARKEHRKSTKSESGVQISKKSPTTTAGEPERPTTAPASAIILASDDANIIQRSTSNTTSPTFESRSRVKSWLKSKFERVSYRHSKSISESSATRDTAGTEKSFVGGHTYTRASFNDSTASLSRHSIQDIANATLVSRSSPTAAATHAPETFERASNNVTRSGDDVSSLNESSGGKGKGREEVISSDSDDDEFLEARENFEDLQRPRPFSSLEPTSVSPGRAAKFHEEI
ncbi:hypothetical protein DSL72_003876 [Monilinia vaccinii-corymbosi]|uniref:Eisosome protein 1 n=1 Tax=Monilinia vaccinii-corymbosi TaxID=61207 RepID=A0A8A3NXX4_9HELO|nr:hypothetical protein DSL72_003876 [Monilinia vaccinii-corymbosi]